MSLLEQEQTLPHGGVTHERRLIRIPDRRSHIISQSSLSEKGWWIAYFSFSLSYSATYDWNFCESASFFSFWLTKWHNGSWYGETSFFRLKERASWAGLLTSPSCWDPSCQYISCTSAPRKGVFDHPRLWHPLFCRSGSRSSRFSCSFSRSPHRLTLHSLTLWHHSFLSKRWNRFFERIKLQMRRNEICEVASQIL